MGKKRKQVTVYQIGYRYNEVYGIEDFREDGYCPAGEYNVEVCW